MAFIQYIASSHLQEAEGRELVQTCFHCPLVARLAAGQLQYGATSEGVAASLEDRTAKLVKDLQDCIDIDLAVDDYPTDVYKVC